jgi:hypothetical protein
MSMVVLRLEVIGSLAIARREREVVNDLAKGTGLRKATGEALTFPNLAARLLQALHAPTPLYIPLKISLTPVTFDTGC